MKYADALFYKKSALIRKRIELVAMSYLSLGMEMKFRNKFTTRKTKTIA